MSEAASVPSPLSRRERQLLDALYESGKATAAELMEKLPDPPSYSAVRATLRILEEKGHVRHIDEGLRYVYLPTVPRETARDSALRHLVRTFFGGSVTQAVSALVDTTSADLSKEDLNELADLIERAKKEGR